MTLELFYDTYDEYLENETYKDEAEILDELNKNMDDNYIHQAKDGDYINKQLLKIRFLIKELGRILYQHKDLNNPDTGTNFYNSYNHYYRIAKKAIEGFNGVEYYGKATIPENRTTGVEVKKCIEKIHDFCFRLEPLTTFPELSRKLKFDEIKQIEELNKALYRLVKTVLGELVGMNYFKFRDTDTGIDELFNFPDSTILNDSGIELTDLF